VPFVTIFTETVKILAIIIASYLGVQTVLDYRMQSNSSVDLKGEQKYIKEEVHIEEYIINQEDLNAPKIRPYSTIAIEE
jgi:hypothetical protein